jgi:hypothetical protein
MGNCANIDHAEHNEKACEYLNKSSDFKDWVITTAFYSAMHFIRHIILPFKTVSNGKTITINNFEHLYSLLKRGNENKHRFLLNFIDIEFQEMYNDYSNLFDLAYKARYVNYKFDHTISDLAIKRLQYIKAFSK